MRAIILYPGTHRLSQQANALAKSGLFSNVILYTSFILKETHWLSRFKFVKKRVKTFHPLVTVRNNPFFEILVVLGGYLNLNRNNNIYYIRNVLFNWFCLPILYLERKNTVVVLYETSGWPLCKYAKKWNVPVIMDFPSITHEAGIQLGVGETQLGIKIKTLERNNIDYALHTSEYAKKTYSNRTSAKGAYTIYPGANIPNIPSLDNFDFSELKIAFIANLEYRKGLDILLKAYKGVQCKKKLYLIGKIDKKWVANFCSNNSVRIQNVVFSGPLAHSELPEFLVREGINLNILPSRFDSFGKVVPETMMLGIPNIVSPHVGAGEKIIHGENGYIMNEFTESSLLKSIIAYQNLSIGEKKSFSSNVKKQALTMTWESYEKQTKTAFTGILAELRRNNKFI